mmetsp:Transcript_10529/g.19090  ORF Transcript_10529/g.19090 Transcript_10529/m.19090 type:complete len:638 (-) Transcript_10529:112-2025(-)
MGNADSKPCCMFGGDTGQAIEVIEADTVLSVELTDDSDAKDKTVILSAGTCTGPHTLSWGAEGLPMVAPIAADNFRRQSQLTPIFQISPEMAAAGKVGLITSAPTRPADASRELEGGCEAIPAEGMAEPSPDPGQQATSGVIVAPPAAVAQPGKDAGQSPFVQLPARVSPHLLYPWRNSLQPPHTSRRPVGPFVGEPFSSLLTYMRVVRVAEKDAQAYTEKDPDIWSEAEEKGRDNDDDSSLRSPFSSLVEACMDGYGTGKYADSNHALEQNTPATSSTQASRAEDFSNDSLVEGERFAKLLLLFELELVSMFTISLMVTLPLTPSMEGGIGVLILVALALAVFTAWLALRVNRKALYPVNAAFLVMFVAATGIAAGLTQLVVPGAFGCQFLAINATASLLFGVQQATGIVGWLVAVTHSADASPCRQKREENPREMSSVLPSTAADLKATTASSIDDTVVTLARHRAVVAAALGVLNWFVAMISCSMLSYVFIEVPQGVSIAVALMSFPSSMALHVSMANHLRYVSVCGVCEAVIGLNTCITPELAAPPHQAAPPRVICPKQGPKCIEPAKPKLNVDAGAGIDDGFARVEYERDSSTDLAVGPQEGSEESCAAPASTCEEDSYTYTYDRASEPMYL